MLKGTARRIKVSNNINSEYILPGQYRFSSKNPKELAKYLFNEVDPDFVKRIKAGDFLIGGENFGCGSSREQAALALKASGLSTVIAKSYSRIFYRNAFNVGLVLLEANTNYIDDGDMLEFMQEKNIIKNLSKGLNIEVKPLPLLIRRIAEDGGIIEYFKKHGGLKLEL